MLYVLVSNAKNCLRYEIAEDTITNILQTLRVICTSSTSVSRQNPVTPTYRGIHVRLIRVITDTHHTVRGEYDALFPAKTLNNKLFLVITPHIKGCLTSTVLLPRNTHINIRITMFAWTNGGKDRFLGGKKIFTYRSVYKVSILLTKEKHKIHPCRNYPI